MVDDAQRKRWAKFRFGLNTQKAQKKDETGTSMAERWLQQKALEGDERAKKALSELLGAGYDARVDTGEFWRSREFKELIRGVDNQVFGSKLGGVPEEADILGGKILAAPTASPFKTSGLVSPRTPSSSYIPPSAEALRTVREETPMVGPQAPPTPEPVQFLTGGVTGGLTPLQSLLAGIQTPAVPDRPESETVWVTSKTGERVPVNLAHREQIDWDIEYGRNTFWLKAFRLLETVGQPGIITEELATSEGLYRREADAMLMNIATTKLGHGYLQFRVHQKERTVAKLKERLAQALENPELTTPEAILNLQEQITEEEQKLETVKFQFARIDMYKDIQWADYQQAKARLPKGFTEEDWEALRKVQKGQYAYSEEYVALMNKYDKAIEAEREDAKRATEHIKNEFDEVWDEITVLKDSLALSLEVNDRMYAAYRMSRRATQIKALETQTRARGRRYAKMFGGEGREARDEAIKNLKERAKTAYDEAYQQSLEQMLPEKKQIYEEAQRQADRYRSMLLAALNRGDDKQALVYEAKFKEANQRVVDIATQHQWEFERLNELYEQAIGKLVQYYRWDAKLDWRNKYGAYSWASDPIAEDQYLQALAEAQLQAGRPLQDDEIRELKELYVNQSVEFIGQIVFDPLNLIDVFGLDKGINLALKGTKWALKNIGKGVVKLLPFGNDLLELAAQASVKTIGNKITADVTDITSRILLGTEVTLEHATDMISDLGVTVDNARHLQTIYGPEAVRELFENAQKANPALQGITFEEFKRLIDATDHEDIVKKISALNWGSEFENSAENVKQNITAAALALVKKQNPNAVGDDLLELLDTELARMLNEREAIRDIVNDWSKKFANAFVNAHVIHEGTRLLDDTILGWIDTRARLFANLPVNQAVKKRLVRSGKYSQAQIDRIGLGKGPQAKMWNQLKSSTIEWATQASNTIRHFWVSMVLTTPRYLIRNMIDSGFRRLVYGGNPLGDIFTLFNSLHASFADDLGVIPYELVQSLARTGLDFNQTPPARLLSGKKFGFLRYWRDAIDQRKLDRMKEAADVAVDIYNRTEHVGLKSTWNQLWNGAKTADFFWAVPDAVSDFNTAMEFTMRLRMFAEEYTKAISRLEPEALGALGKLSGDTRAIGQHIWDLSGNNAAKIRGYVDDLTKPITEDALRGRTAWSMLVPPNIKDTLDGMSNADKFLFTNEVKRAFDDFVKKTLNQDGSITKAGIGRWFDDYIEEVMQESSRRISQASDEVVAGGAIGDEMSEIPNPSDLSGSSPMSRPETPPAPTRDTGRIRATDLFEAFQEDAAPYMDVKLIDKGGVELQNIKGKPTVVIGRDYIQKTKEKKFFSELRDAFIRGYGDSEDNIAVFRKAGIKDNKQFLDNINKLHAAPEELLKENPLIFHTLVNQLEDDYFARELIERLTGRKPFKYGTLAELAQGGAWLTDDAFKAGWVDAFRAALESANQEIRALPDFFRIAGNQFRTTRAKVWNTINSDLLPTEVAEKLRRFYTTININERTVANFFRDVYPGPKRIQAASGRSKLWEAYYQKGTMVYETSVARDMEFLRMIDEGNFDELTKRLDAAINEIDDYFVREIGIDIIWDDYNNIAEFSMDGNKFTRRADVRAAQESLYGAHVHDEYAIYKITNIEELKPSEQIRVRLIQTGNYSRDQARTLAAMIDEHAKWFMEAGGGWPPLYENYFKKLGFKKVKGMWQVAGDGIEIGEKLMLGREAGRFVVYGMDNMKLEDSIKMVSSIWYNDMIELSAVNGDIARDLEHLNDYLKRLSGQGIRGNKLTKKQRDLFGEVFVQYLREGVGDEIRLTKSFQKFKEWLVIPFDAMKGTRFQADISDEIYSILNKSLNEVRKSPVPSINARKARVIATEAGHDMSDDMIVNTVNNAMYHLERSPEMQATRELITNQLKFAGYSEAQSYSIVQLMDAYARATGDVPGWYDKYFSGIKVLDSIEDITDPNALFKSPFEDYGKKAINEILDGAGFDDAQLDRFSLVRIQKMTGVPEDILENLVPKPYRQLVSIFLSTPHGADFLPKGVSEKIGKEIVEHFNAVLLGKKLDISDPALTKKFASQLEDIIDKALSTEAMVDNVVKNTYLTAEKALKMSPRELALADWAVTKALREFEETAVRDTLLRMPEHMGKSYDELIKLGVFKKRILPESITETKFQAMRRFISERSLYANVQDIYLDAVRRLVPEDQWENFAPKAQQTQEIIRALRGSGGAVSFLEDGSALMHIVKGAEYDTAIHEIGHVFRNSLDDLQLKRLEGIVGLDEGEFKSLRPTFEEYRTLKNKKRLNKAQKARMDEIEADALRYEAAEERFADDFTTYLRNGEAPVQELKTLFEKFKRWLQEIFSKLRNNADLKLTDSMKDFMDDLFAHGSPVSGIYRSVDEIPENVVRKAFDYEEAERWHDTVMQGWDVWKIQRRYQGFPPQALESPQKMRAYLTSMRRGVWDDASDVYRRYLVDLERFEAGMLSYKYGDSFFGTLFPTVNEAELGDSMLTFLRNVEGNLSYQESAVRALKEWKAFAMDLVENNGIYWRELTQSQIDELAAWADEATKSKASITKQAADEAIEKTNFVMLDYATRSRFDEFARNIFPFWMFPSRSWPFWIETMIQHPNLIAIYHKFNRASRTGRRQAGAVDSTGRPLRSLRGYFRIPGTGMWVNPNSAISLTYVLDEALHPDYEWIDTDKETEPVAYVIERFIENATQFGFNPAPWWGWAAKWAGILPNDAVPRFPSHPVIPLMPRWLMKELEYKANNVPFIGDKWLSPAVGATTDAFYPEAPWHDYLVETEMLAELNQLLQDPRVPHSTKWEAYQKLKSTLQYRREGNPESNWDEVAEWNAAYKKYTNDEAIRSATSFFTGFYPKPFTDSRADLLAVRNRHNMLVSAINDKLQAAAFNLPVDDDDIWQFYIDQKDTPEGWIYSMYSDIGWVRNPEGELVRDPIERAEHLAAALQVQDNQIEYWRAVSVLEDDLQEELKMMPVGAPYEDIKAIYDEFFEAMEDLKDEWDIKKYEMLHGTNKTPQQIQDTWTREWYRALNESRPIWDVKNGQTYEEYEINMQMWRENLPNLASSLLPAFVKHRAPFMEKLREDQQFDFEGYVSALVAMSTPEAYTEWKRMDDDVFDALNHAYKTVYWDTYWESGVLEGGYAGWIAANKWAEQFPDGYPTTDQLFEAITAIYGDRFTREEVMKWVEYAPPAMTIDERMIAKHGELYPKKQEIWRILTSLGPGRAGVDLMMIGRLAAPDNFDTWVTVWYETTGYGYDRKPDEFEAFYNTLKQAAEYINLPEPTNEQMEEFIEAQKLNAEFRSLVEQELGDDFYEATLGYYYGLEREERKLIRQYVPQKYKDINTYYGMKDAFGNDNPLWKAYYVTPEENLKLGREWAKGLEATFDVTSPSVPQETGEPPLTWEEKRRRKKAREGEDEPPPKPAAVQQEAIGFGASTASQLRWPMGMQGSISPHLEYEINNAYRYGQALSGSAQTYLNELYMHHPEWRGFIRFIFAKSGA